MTKHRPNKCKGHCGLCGRTLGNSTSKGTSAWKHLRKLGIKRRAQNERVSLARALDRD